jgi:hypothetical protein
LTTARHNVSGRCPEQTARGLSRRHALRTRGQRAVDLLSTAAHHTRVYANDRANWPAVQLAIPLPEAATFGAVTRESALRAGEVLGLARRICERELDRLALALPSALDDLAQTIAIENAHYPESVRPFLAGEIRLIDTIRHLVVPEMLRSVARA